MILGFLGVERAKLDCLFLSIGRDELEWPLCLRMFPDPSSMVASTKELGIAETVFRSEVNGTLCAESVRRLLDIRVEDGGGDHGVLPPVNRYAIMGTLDEARLRN